MDDMSVNTRKRKLTVINNHSGSKQRCYAVEIDEEDSRRSSSCQDISDSDEDDTFDASVLYYSDGQEDTCAEIGAEEDGLFFDSVDNLQCWYSVEEADGQSSWSNDEHTDEGDTLNASVLYYREEPEDTCTEIDQDEEEDYFDAEDIASQQFETGNDEIYADTFSSTDNDVSYWDSLCHPDSILTRGESVLMLMTFIIRHHLTKQAIKDLLALVNLHIANLFPSSQYILEKFFSINKEIGKVEKHFYCKNCQGYLGTDDVDVCQLCGKGNLKSQNLKEGNFFIVMPLKHQIKSVLEKVGFTEHNTELGLLADIRDGKIYKTLQENGTLGPMDFSFQWNCDGVPVFKSSNYSIWPVQLMLNEIPIRQRKSHIILASLWFGTGKPRMDTFLKPFVEECNKLSTEGILWTNPADGSQVQSKIFNLVCTSDAVARPVLRNTKQFNGEYGCDWCIHPGRQISKGDGHARTYPLEGAPYSERTEENFTQDALRATETGRPSRGIKGISALLLLNTFEIVRGFVPDYLHAVLLGVTRQLASLWFDSCNHGKPFYIGKHWKDVDKVLLAQKPPSEITRRPRSLATRRFWKASEWRAFLLFYSLISLKGILPARFLQHLQLLVFAIQTLLQETIHTSSLQKAEQALMKFVGQMHGLYGLENVSFNIHQLTHLAESVKNWGPLWGISTFSFESNGGHLLQMCNGTQYIPAQICHALARHQATQAFAIDVLKIANGEAENMYKQLRGDVSHQTYHRFNETTVGVGMHSTRSFSVTEQVAMENFLEDDVESPKGTFYSRFLHFGHIYHGTSYKRKDTKENNTVVVTKDDKFLQIESLVLYRDCNCSSLSCHCAPDLYVFGKLFDVRQVNDFHVANFGNVLLKAQLRRQKIVLPLDRIRWKCILLNYRNELYLKPLPNPYEWD